MYKLFVILNKVKWRNKFSISTRIYRIESYTKFSTAFGLATVTDFFNIITTEWHSTLFRYVYLPLVSLAFIIFSFLTYFHILRILLEISILIHAPVIYYYAAGQWTLKTTANRCRRGGHVQRVFGDDVKSPIKNF